MMLGVERQKREERIRECDFGFKHRAIPVHHRVLLRGAEHDVGEFDRRDAAARGSCLRYGMDGH